MFEWKKTQILIADKKEGVDLDKKVQPGTRGFCPYFCAVDHPICEFIFLIIRKELLRTKKVQLGTRGFLSC